MRLTIIMVLAAELWAPTAGTFFSPAGTILPLAPGQALVASSQPLGGILEISGYRCASHDQQITCIDTGPTYQAVKKRAEEHHAKIFGCAIPSSKNYPCVYENIDAKETRWRQYLEQDCEPKTFMERKCAPDLESCTQ